MEEYELSSYLDVIKADSGRGTWYVTLLIRPDKSLSSMYNRIVQEISEAQSIKSDETRENVESSLKKIRDVLQRYDSTPENGLAIFANPDDIYILDDLPFDVPENRYHCDDEFLVEPLNVNDGGTYGLVVVERGRAAIGVLTGGAITNVIEKESHVMGKQKAGGQSQKRFERLRENQKHEFYKDVQETAYASWKPYDLDGVVIGGTLTSAKDFADRYTNHNWNVLGTYSVDHGDSQGLSELVSAAQSDILTEEEADIRDDVESFLTAMRNDMAVYGEGETMKFLERGQLETVILSTEVNNIREIQKTAESFDTAVTVVNPTFEEAKMFQRISSGYGGIRRW